MKRTHLWSFTGLVGWLVVLGGCGGPAMVPTSYESFTDKHNTFKIQAPCGWSADSGGDDKKYSWAAFTSGSTSIVFDVDGMRALILRTATTGINPMVPGGANGLTLAVDKVHWLEKPEFEEKMRVKEEKEESVETGLGQTLKSQYTSTAEASSPIRGYRATAVRDDKRIKITCTCPAGEWDKLKPVFDKVIDSLSR
jgi:hypothetical protein